MNGAEEVARRVVIARCSGAFTFICVKRLLIRYRIKYTGLSSPWGCLFVVFEGTNATLPLIKIRSISGAWSSQTLYAMTVCAGVPAINALARSKSRT